MICLPYTKGYVVCVGDEQGGCYMLVTNPVMHTYMEGEQHHTCAWLMGGRLYYAQRCHACVVWPTTAEGEAAAAAAALHINISDIRHGSGIILVDGITGDLDWNYMLQQQREILVMMTK